MNYRSLMAIESIECLLEEYFYSVALSDDEVNNFLGILRKFYSKDDVGVYFLEDLYIDLNAHTAKSHVTCREIFKTYSKILNDLYEFGVDNSRILFNYQGLLRIIYSYNCLNGAARELLNVDLNKILNYLLNADEKNNYKYDDLKSFKEHFNILYNDYEMIVSDNFQNYFLEPNVLPSLLIILESTINSYNFTKEFHVIVEFLNGILAKHYSLFAGNRLTGESDYSMLTQFSNITVDFIHNLDEVLKNYDNSMPLLWHLELNRQVFMENFYDLSNKYINLYNPI